MIPGLPDLSPRRLAVRVTPDALRQVRGGHPWVYGEAITSVSDASAAPGTLAVIFDQSRSFAAIGLWDPTSPIRIRVLHAGRPKTVDVEFWNEVVERACARRATLQTSDTTGYRVLNGENDGVGGLIVDRYDATLVCKVYSAAWLPHLDVVLQVLAAKVQPERIVLRLGRLAGNDDEVIRSGLRDGMVIHGEDPGGPVRFHENGLTFEADVLHGQKTGHFLDQRDNRAFVRSVARGARVLDVFSCTGGFSVHAAAGGATHVHSVDIAAPAIDAVARNLEHNRAATAGVDHIATVGDAFEVMSSLGARGDDYDIVIIDPPSFASRASERNGALRAYRKLTELGLTLLRPGGRLFQASCSSRVTEDDLVSTVRAAIRSQGLMFRDPQLSGHAIDHPVTFPQGRYLKAITGTLHEQ